MSTIAARLPQRAARKSIPAGFITVHDEDEEPSADPDGDWPGGCAASAKPAARAKRLQSLLHGACGAAPALARPLDGSSVPGTDQEDREAAKVLNALQYGALPGETHAAPAAAAGFQQTAGAPQGPAGMQAASSSHWTPAESARGRGLLPPRTMKKLRRTNELHMHPSLTALKRLVSFGK